MPTENDATHQGCEPGVPTNKYCKRAPCTACGPRFACIACSTGFVLDPKTKKCRECVGPIVGACGVCPKDKGGVTLGKVSEPAADPQPLNSVTVLRPAERASATPSPLDGVGSPRADHMPCAVLADQRSPTLLSNVALPFCPT